MASAKEIQNRKVNARLYPIYKMISWDLLFYYSIIYLFVDFSTNKNTVILCYDVCFICFT